MGGESAQYAHRAGNVAVCTRKTGKHYDSWGIKVKTQRNLILIIQSKFTKHVQSGTKTRPMMR